MYPWLWYWSPTFHFPFGGNVAQQIEPDTRWFFAGIPAQAGNGDIEKKAFEVASYGRQLGWITEVLLAAAKPGSIDPAKAGESLRKLEKAYRKIENVKQQSRNELAEAAQAAIAKLHAADPAACDRLLAQAPKRLKAPRSQP